MRIDLSLTATLLLLFLVACTTKDSANEKAVTKDTLKTTTGIVSDTTTSPVEIIEVFVDSTNIGEKGTNKIELIKHRVLGDNYVIVKFYTRGPKYWYTQNTYIYECDTEYDLDPYIADFNNDKLNDITFISATAARGANEVRRLFIYDKHEMELTSIVNSEDYPNMRYNKELDCIDAFLVYGGCSTVFTKIKGDSLIEFAHVENDLNRTVYEIDKNGKEKILRKDSITDPDKLFMRYSNYKPLKEYISE